jgi:DHA2 family multidrug resistance protein-like MFS transporter
VLALTGVTSITYAIVEQREYGWTDTRVPAALAAGVVLLAAFVVQELRLRAPLVDLRLFLKGRFTWSTFAFVVVGFVLSGVLFVLSPYIQIVQGNDAMATGIRVLPIIATLIVGSAVTGRLTARLGAHQPGSAVATGMIVASVVQVI